MLVDSVTRTNRLHRLPLAGVCAVLLSIATLGASTPALTSHWRTQDIHVDGVNNEWTSLDVLEKGPAVAVANDDTNLYVIVSASDLQMRRQIGSGIVLWFDPTGGKKETFALGIPGALRHQSQSSGSPDSAADTSPVSVPAEVVTDFDVYGPAKNERHWIRMDPAFGIEMASAFTEGTLVYELKVPLAKSDAHPYALDAKPRAVIGFAVATPEVPNVQASRGAGGVTGGAGGGGGYGGRGGFGRGGGGRGGGMGGGRSQEYSASRPKPIKIWTKLTLATAPAGR